MNILQQIVADKQRDLPRLKEQEPLAARCRRSWSVEELLESLRQKCIIAEVKRRSPSMGAVDVDLLQQAKDYQAGGAAMISVLTDEAYFSGSFGLLKEIGQQVDCPLLCKDFIVDEWQLEAAHSAGADAVLLIATCFTEQPHGEERLRQLYDYATNLGLLPLVELYSPAERYAAYQLQPLLLGVNSRDLQNMHINLQRGANTLALLWQELSMPQARAVRAQRGLPDMPLFVGESGISQAADAVFWGQHGADCLLIGTSLMQTAAQSTQGQQNSGAELLRLRIAEFRSAWQQGRGS